MKKTNIQCNRRVFFYYSFLVSLVVLGGATIISLSCSWAYRNLYDEADTRYSSAAVALMGVALSFAVFAITICVTGAMRRGLLREITEMASITDKWLKWTIVARFCALVLISVLSFGVLQVVSGGLMIKSLVINTAINVRVFAVFIVLFDFFAAIFGLYAGIIMCYWLWCGQLGGKTEADASKSGAKAQESETMELQDPE